MFSVLSSLIPASELLFASSSREQFAEPNISGLCLCLFIEGRVAYKLRGRTLGGLYENASVECPLCESGMGVFPLSHISSPSSDELSECLTVGCAGSCDRVSGNAEKLQGAKTRSLLKDKLYSDGRSGKQPKNLESRLPG